MQGVAACGTILLTSPPEPMYLDIIFDKFSQDIVMNYGYSRVNYENRYRLSARSTDTDTVAQKLIRFGLLQQTGSTTLQKSPQILSAKTNSHINKYVENLMIAIGVNKQSSAITKDARKDFKENLVGLMVTQPKVEGKLVWQDNKLSIAATKSKVPEPVAQITHAAQAMTEQRSTAQVAPEKSLNWLQKLNPMNW
jgi:hypothetical protein